MITIHPTSISGNISDLFILRFPEADRSLASVCHDAFLAAWTAVGNLEYSDDEIRLRVVTPLDVEKCLEARIAAVVQVMRSVLPEEAAIEQGDVRPLPDNGGGTSLYRTNASGNTVVARMREAELHVCDANHPYLTGGQIWSDLESRHLNRSQFISSTWDELPPDYTWGEQVPAVDRSQFSVDTWTSLIESGQIDAANEYVLQQKLLECVTLGCSDVDRDRHQAVAAHLANSAVLQPIAHWIAPGAEVIQMVVKHKTLLAAARLLYNRLAAGTVVIPATDADASVWAEGLWDMLTEDNQKFPAMRLRTLHPGVFESWVQLAIELWQNIPA